MKIEPNAGSKKKSTGKVKLSKTEILKRAQHRAQEIANNKGVAYEILEDSVWQLGDTYTKDGEEKTATTNGVRFRRVGNERDYPLFVDKVKVE